MGVATCDIIDVKSEYYAITTFMADNPVDIIIVTSVYAVAAAENAVKSLLKEHGSSTASQHAQNTQRNLPLIIAVGDATKKKLTSALSQIKHLTILTPEKHTSEGILAMPQLLSLIHI